MATHSRVLAWRIPGTGSLVGFRLWGRTELNTTEATQQQQQQQQQTAAQQASLSFTISQSLLKLIFIESIMPSNHLILYCPLLLLPSIFPSITVFSNELALLSRWPKYWSFSNNPSNEYSGLISFRIDWFDLLSDSQDSSPAPQFESISKFLING